MAKFVINIDVSRGEHRLVRFEVPDTLLEGTTDYNEVVNRAGWYYMNHIDAMSCTGPYSWSVFPEGLLLEISDRS